MVARRLLACLLSRWLAHTTIPQQPATAAPSLSSLRCPRRRLASLSIVVVYRECQEVNWYLAGAVPSKSRSSSLRWGPAARRSLHVCLAFQAPQCLGDESLPSRAIEQLSLAAPTETCFTSTELRLTGPQPTKDINRDTGNSIIK